jgi:hypothetical protein
MTPVTVPAGPCADATFTQQTAATDANRAKLGFSMLSLPLVQAIEIGGHNRNGACGTLPITSLISALRRNRHNAWLRCL